MKIIKTLTAFGEIMQAEKIVKTETSILGYIEGLEVFAFQGIRDFSFFTLSDGEVWNIAELTEIEQLKVRQLETENAVLTLMELQMMGGI